MLSHGERGPILLDALQVSPIPGDPDDVLYDTHVLSFPISVVIAQGSVTSASSTDSCATLSFPLAVSDYVWSSVKCSTVLSIHHQPALLSHTRLINLTA